MRLSHSAKIGLMLACFPIVSSGIGNSAPESQPQVLSITQPTDVLYKSARDAEESGRLEIARDLYGVLQQKSPGIAEYAHRMGVVCTRLQDHVNAWVYFEHARSLDPNDPILLADMGYAAYSKKDYTTAETLLAQSLQIRPEQTGAVNNLAMAIGFQGRYEEALAVFRRVNSEEQSRLNVAFIQQQRLKSEKLNKIQDYSSTSESISKLVSGDLSEVAKNRVIVAGESEGESTRPSVIAADVSSLAAIPTTGRRIDAALPDPAQFLKGFCPVALRNDRRLATAREEFTSRYQGQTYCFCSAEARDEFIANPDLFVPAAKGLDVIEVKRRTDVKAGSLEHACWYRNRLHLFSSGENLEKFRASPRQYVENK